MNFSLTRALVFACIGMPLGFIFTAFGFALTASPIEASSIFPWALTIAAIIGIVGGLRRSSR